MDNSPPPNNSASSSSNVEESSSIKQGQNNLFVTDFNYRQQNYGGIYTQQQQAFTGMTHQNLQPATEQQWRRVPIKFTLKNKIQNTKHIRTTFTSAQLLVLENEFAATKFLNRLRRIELSQELNLTEDQIKVWFQNKRMKLKKEDEAKVSSSSSIDSSTHPLMPRQKNTVKTENVQSSIVRRLLIHSPLIQRKQRTFQANSIYNNQLHIPGQYPNRGQIYNQRQNIASAEMNSVYQPNSASLQSSEYSVPYNWDSALSFHEEDCEVNTSKQLGQHSTNNDNSNS